MHNKVKHSLNMALIQTNCYLFLFLSYRFVLQNAVIFPYKFSLMLDSIIVRINGVRLYKEK